MPFSKWKSGFEFDEAPRGTGFVAETGIATSSGVANEQTTTTRKQVLNRFLPKGTYQKNVGDTFDVPDLMSVVTAKPEIKERATAEAEARERKIMQRRASGRIKVNPTLAQRKDKWTKALTGQQIATPPRNIVGNKLQVKKRLSSQGKIRPELLLDLAKDSSGDKDENDTSGWKGVYEMIKSPRTGKTKTVAKQDIASEEKIPSPKKKPRPRPKGKGSGKKSKQLSEGSTKSTSSKSSKTSKTSKKKKRLSKSLSASSASLASTQEEKSEWGEVYEDILSPKSGKKKSVAKQDLKSENIPSPKKKSKRKLKRKSSSSKLKKSREKKSSSKEFVPAEEHTAEANKGEKEDQSYLPSNLSNHTSMRDAKSDDDTSSKFVDESDSDFQSSDESTVDIMPMPSSLIQPKKQIVLEFMLPSEEGRKGLGREVPVDLETYGDMSSVDSWPSIESNDSYDTRMNKMLQRWVDVHAGDDIIDEDQRTIYDNDVNLVDNTLDHIIIAAPDLDEAMEQFEKLSGIKPYVVGPLQGLGARTAHVGLDNNRYIEIIAPDNDQPGPLGEELKDLEPGILTPYHYSIRSSEVSRLIEGYVYDVLGWDPDHIAMVQTLPDHRIRQWDLLTMYGHDMGGCAPCYVKWKNPSQHPTATIALKAMLASFTVVAPKDHHVHKLITGVDGINIEHGDRPSLELTVETPNGLLAFSSDKPKGLVFPGYETAESEPSDLLVIPEIQPEPERWDSLDSDDFLDCTSESGPDF